MLTSPQSCYSLRGIRCYLLDTPPDLASGTNVRAPLSFGGFVVFCIGAGWTTPAAARGIPTRPVSATQVSLSPDDDFYITAGKC